MINYEKKALVKFMLIYMISSFILFFFVAVLYYFDQRHIVIKELKDDMISYISLSRSGNNVLNNNFNLKIEPSKHHKYPIFYENKKNNKYVSVTCASKEKPNSVFIVSADQSVLDDKLYSLKLKITFILVSMFFIFLLVAYYLARISIRPLQESRQRINNVIEDILHDLNAPMTAISMNCEALENTINSDKEIKKIDRIVSSNKTIKFLYNNLSSLLDHPIKFKKEVIDIDKVLQDRIELYRDLNPEVTFNVSLAPEKCHADSVSLERIIDNLISNAIKYSQPNPHISISNKNQKIIIEDNGIGIKDCESIFIRNYRETQGITEACGLGLGLSIVKKLCDEMEMKIKLENNKPTGSRFIIHCEK